MGHDQLRKTCIRPRAGTTLKANLTHSIGDQKSGPPQYLQSDVRSALIWEIRCQIRHNTGDQIESETGNNIERSHIPINAEPNYLEYQLDEDDNCDDNAVKMD